MRARRFATLLLPLALTVAGCTEKLVEPPPSPPVEFSVPDSIQTIFSTSCFGGTCHNAAAPAAGQNLSDARTSWLNIVDVASTEESQFDRIAPGDSANSYMVMKLRGDPRISGARMPLNRPPLDPALIFRIASWAAQGAPGTPLLTARQAPSFSTSTKLE